jgi:hypothetical protein
MDFHDKFLSSAFSKKKTFDFIMTSLCCIIFSMQVNFHKKTANRFHSMHTPFNRFEFQGKSILLGLLLTGPGNAPGLDLPAPAPIPRGMADVARAGQRLDACHRRRI